MSNTLDGITKDEANIQAIFNIYAYIADKGVKPKEENEFSKIILDLEDDFNKNSGNWKADDIEYLNKLISFEENNSDINLDDYVIVDQIITENGINACAFTDSKGNVSVVFRGTGKGEWIDNGEGLSGIPEENTYENYDENGNLVSLTTVEKDYATDQQVEALNWFNKIASKNGWTEETNITISGHSKGGNKAQFITMNSDLIDKCYSFDGQGFSPEAIESFKEKYGDKFDERRKKMFSFSCYNDYVNVLGKRLIPEENIYFFKSSLGDDNFIYYHFIFDMLDEYGRFNAQCEQGDISKCIEELSDELMEMEPLYRQFATLGIMNLLQRFREPDAIPVNGDYVSGGTTAVGGIIIIEPLITNLFGKKTGLDALKEVDETYNDDVIEAVIAGYNEIGEKYGEFAEAGAIIASIAVIACVAVIVVKTGLIPKLISKGIGLLTKVPFIVALKSLAKKLSELTTIDDYIKNYIDRFVARVTGLYDELYNNKNSVTTTYISGASYVPDTYIEVDTRLLRQYADSLDNTRRKAQDLDAMIAGFYRTVDNLCGTNYSSSFYGYSGDIARCVDYLNYTANEFEMAEREIISAALA